MTLSARPRSAPYRRIRSRRASRMVTSHDRAGRCFPAVAGSRQRELLVPTHSGWEHAGGRRRRTSRRRRGTRGASLCLARLPARRRGLRVVPRGRVRAMRPVGSTRRGCQVGEGRGRAGGSCDVRRRVAREQPRRGRVGSGGHIAAVAQVLPQQGGNGLGHVEPVRAELERVAPSAQEVDADGDTGAQALRTRGRGAAVAA